MNTNPRPVSNASDKPTDSHPEPEILEDITTGLDTLVIHAGRLCSWLVLVAMLISVYEVIARYVFDSPTAWVHETAIFLVAAIFALGGPYALAKNRHIQIRLLGDMLSPNKRYWLNLLNILLGIGFCISIGYASYVLAFNATHTPTGIWRLQTSGSAWNSPLPAFTKVIILISVVLMALQLILRFGHLINRKPK